MRPIGKVKVADILSMVFGVKDPGNPASQRAVFIACQGLKIQPHSRGNKLAIAISFDIQLRIE